MNKAKAYHRLKQKQRHSNSAACWTELAAAQGSTPRLPLQVIKSLNTARTSSEDLNQPQTLPDKDKSNAAMYGIRRHNTYKHFNEDRDHVTKSQAAQPAAASLPFLLSSNNQQLTSIQENKQSSLLQASSKVNSIRRPVTTGGNDSADTPAGYTLLQAKLEALILPNPVKRKASRSFSGSSSGLHGRKLSISGRDGMRQVIKQSTDTENRSPRHSASSIQFPAASKMRQLLKKDQTEPPGIQRGKEYAILLTTLQSASGQDNDIGIQLFSDSTQTLGFIQDIYSISY